MTRSAPLRNAAFAAAALLLTAGGLTGCGREHAPESAPPPPIAAEQPLAGAPDSAPPPVYVAPQGPPPGEPMMDAPSAAPGLVAMAPIPNPPEPERPARRYGRHYGRRHRVHLMNAAPAVHRRHRHARRMHVQRMHMQRTRVHRSHAPAAARQAPVARASAPPMRGRLHHRAAPAAAPASPAAGPAKPEATVAQPRADRVAALQTALAGAASTSAVLAAPHFQVNTPADVTLTVPASFADTLRTESGRQGLADDAASAALTSRLAGDGYVVIPDASQRQVIVAGQPTVFHWTATQEPGARGALQAQLGAQLLGGGQDQLDLGVVKAGATGGVGWRVVGGVLLALVVALIVALFARSGRRTPAVVERRRDVGVQRPFDMGGNEPPRA